MTCDAVREKLGEFITGALPEEETAEVARHLEGCPACAEEGRQIQRLDGLLKDLRPSVSPARARPALRPWVRGLAASAAAVLLAVGAAWWWPSRDAGRAHRLPEGERIAGRDERFRTGPEELRPLSLPDGTRIRVGQASEVRFLPAAEGERLRLELVHGSLEAEVEKGEGRVRIRSEAGEIAVLGTSFTAKAFRIRTPSPLGGEGQGEGDMPVLAVEVTEGRVEVSGAAGAHPVPAGRRGIVRGGDAPFACVQEAVPLPWREALKRWGQKAGSDSFPESVEALTLLAGRWEGLASWARVAEDPSASAEEKRRAAVLARLAREEAR